MDLTHVAISGSSGWLGTELIRVINESRHINAELTLISSQNKTIAVDNKIYKTYDFYNLPKIDPLDIYFDFAFLTRDKIKPLGLKTYRLQVLELINASVRFIQVLKPRTVVLSSSGAVYFEKNSVHNNFDLIYSELKNVQEKLIGQVCAENNINLVISRIFNLSGRGCDRLEHYVLPYIIDKCLKNKTVDLISERLVFRRYCDISELLELLIILGQNKRSLIFDSGGPATEIRALAYLIKSILKSESELKYLYPKELSVVDAYLSSSFIYEGLIKLHFNKEVLSLEKQIFKTRNYLGLRQ